MSSPTFDVSFTQARLLSDVLETEGEDALRAHRIPFANMGTSLKT